jgi:hypothetical protein
MTNDKISRWPGRWRGRRRSRSGARRAAILAVMTCALLISACTGGSPSDSSSSSSAGGSSNAQKEVAYADCMRSHGVDVGVGSNGAVTANDPSSLPSVSPAVQTAFNACRHLAPTVHLSTGQQEQDLKQMLNYVACMRKHGEPDMPDPSSGSGGAAIPLSGINPKSSQFQAAQQACQSMLRGIAGPAGSSAP